jgi:hypothetical protein
MSSLKKINRNVRGNQGESMPMLFKIPDAVRRKHKVCQLLVFKVSVNTAVICNMLEESHTSECV